MGFRVSPGVTVTEKDLTTVVPAVAATRAGIAGVFRWGPVNKVQLVTSEDDLARRFGKPTSLNPQTFFSAAAFLTYGNALQVVRAANTSGSNTDIANTSLNAVANTGATTNAIMLGSIVKHNEHYLTVDGSFDSAIAYVAKYPGELGNSLKISVCDSANAYTSSFTLFSNANFNSNTAIAFTMNSNTATATFQHSGGGSNTDTAARAAAFIAALTVGDLIKAGNTTIGTQDLKVTSVGSATSVNSTTHTVTVNFAEKFRLGADWSANAITRKWEYFNLIDHSPGQSAFQAAQGNTSANDTLHVVVVDQDGKFTGVPGTVLQTHSDLSRATDAKAENGSSIYYKDVINSQSQYVWFANHRSGAAANTALNLASSTNETPLTLSFVNGADGLGEGTVSMTNLTTAWDFYRNAEEVDVSLLIAGLARGTNGTVLANYLIALCDQRKDCMVFISPEEADVVNAQYSEYDNIKAFRDNLTNSSFAVLDSGYKYAYDKYNDVYRWVPLNGDVAGLLARTEVQRDAWWSPAGFNRGGIANVVKLAWNPSEPQRDLLYKADINPVVTFKGQGTVLFGDKTLYGKPSAFDRINVRRLFIVLEKAIATAANFSLFEFNDSFTRAQFRNIVEPFLRTIQGRRGITDFRVVCDETNNTGEVIDRNEFIADIYIKPARSINFITLNFVAVRTGVEFSEIVGRA